MKDLGFSIREAVNEPIKEYNPGSPEKLSLKKKLEELSSNTYDIPIIINGQEIRTGDTGDCVMPHNHSHILAKYHKAGKKEVEMAIDSHYIELRKTDKSHDESLENRNLNKTPQQTEDYMFILYKYCGFDDILNEFWGSQSLRENSFQNKN